MGKYKEVTKELLELVNLKKSAREIANILGINYTSVHKKLRKLGINLYNYHNELKFDNTVFDDIDTEEKAYWLGFLFADGHISSTVNTVELALKGEDKEHLEKYNNFLRNKASVKTSKVKCKNKEYTRCRCGVTNKHFHDTLVSLGCVPRKSLILKFPDASIFKNTSLIRHFIRGYFDGDGCICATKRGRMVLSVMGTKEFLEELNLFLPVRSFVYLKDKRRPNTNTYTITFSCSKADCVAKYLYKDSTIYLNRKYNRFCRLVQ